jgi:hypothetical protein
MVPFEGILRLESSMSVLHAIQLLVNMVGIVKATEIQTRRLRCQGMMGQVLLAVTVLEFSSCLWLETTELVM